MTKAPGETKFPQPKCLGGFALLSPGHPTKVDFHKFADGSVLLALTTEQRGADPLVTRMIFSPTTFSMVSEGLFRLAHDPSVLIPLDEVPAPRAPRTKKVKP